MVLTTCIIRTVISSDPSPNLTVWELYGLRCPLYILLPLMISGMKIASAVLVVKMDTTYV
uniref:Uncharacterized protein n=1 Tax=Rhizophora mucronata TaxID=61149 RepID=A0A2P2PBS7_RHIMU